MSLTRNIRCRKGLVFKLILAVPLLWFSSIGFAVVLTGNNNYNNNNQLGGNDAGHNLQKRYVRPEPTIFENVKRPEDNVIEQPVLDKPLGGDRSLLLERMRQDAAADLRDREAERHLVLGEAREKVAMAPQIPQNPFHDHVVQEKILRGEAVPKVVADPNAPGEQGQGVNIDKTKLSASERQRFDEGWQKNAFNQYASDMISIHRSLPDVRDKECQTIHYQDHLPDTSVVVIFHNEAWTVLLRTVHSVLDRSPPHLLKEVILVDDCSEHEHLKQQLQSYVDKQPKVKLVRAKKREGLIRARLLGASVAQGEVITFLDSHCEAAEGWLEPLLARIGEDETNVVCPVIDVIEDETLKYVHHQGAGSVQIGGFDWNLQYNWHPVPEREKQRRKSYVDPIRSPTMAGGLFSISKAYFEKLGTYDPGMDIWGGENLELSFRVWMCGGILEIVPCSHVGHIFRKRSPYSWKTGVNVVKKNSVRLAEVWMDEYKTYYYERFNFDLGEYGDVTGRRELRERLHCKTFDWYIKNVFPELFIPGQAVASGEVRNRHPLQDTPYCLDGSTDGDLKDVKVKMWPCHNAGGNQIRSKAKSMCVDSSVDHHSYNKPIKMWPCHNQGGNQYWMLSKSGEIRRDEGCLDYAGKFVMIYPCHGMRGNQEWVYEIDNTIRHKNTNMCIQLGEDGKQVEMSPCTGIDRQTWSWNRKSPLKPASTIPPGIR